SSENDEDGLSEPRGLVNQWSGSRIRWGRFGFCRIANHFLNCLAEAPNFVSVTSPISFPRGLGRGVVMRFGARGQGRHGRRACRQVLRRRRGCKRGFASRRL